MSAESGNENGLAERINGWAEKKGVSTDKPEVFIKPVIGDLAADLPQYLGGAPIFQRDGQVVTVAATGAVTAVKPAGLITLLDAAVKFYVLRQVPGEDGETASVKKYRSIPGNLASPLIEAPAFITGLRKLEAVNLVRKPVSDGKGGVRLLPAGYDAASGVWTVDSVNGYTEMSAIDAKELLYSRFDEFPWPKGKQGGRSFAVFVASLLAVFCRELLAPGELRPSFVFNANASRSGKSLLASVAQALVTGRVAVRAAPADPEKRQELLHSVALSASEVLILDNVRGRAAWENVEAFICSPQIEGRRFRMQSDFSVENKTAVFLTGNGTEFTVSGDLANRSLFIDLWSDCADLSERKFREVLSLARLCSLQFRKELLSACWALVKNWAGKAKRPVPMRRLSGFEAACDLLGGICLAAGLDDPCQRPEMQSGGDEETRDIRELVKALHGQPGDGLSFVEVVLVAQHWGLFSWIVGEVETGEEFDLGQAGTDSGLDQRAKSRFGKLLRRWAPEEGQAFTFDDGSGGRLVLRFSHSGTKGKSRRFQVHKVNA